MTSVTEKNSEMMNASEDLESRHPTSTPICNAYTNKIFRIE